MKLLTFTYFLQLQSTIIQVKHANYQKTFFQLGLWNSYQEIEKAHVNLPLKSEVDWLSIWTVISLFVTLYAFCDIRSDPLPAQGSSGGVCKRVHTYGEIVGLDMRREEDTCNMCFRTLSDSTEESTKWEIWWRSRDSELLMWWTEGEISVRRQQNHDDFSGTKFSKICFFQSIRGLHSRRFVQSIQIRYHGKIQTKLHTPFFIDFWDSP